MKTILVGALALAALLGGRPAAATEDSQPPLSGGSCLSLAGQAPEPLWQTGDGCYNLSFCPDDDYCWQLCSTALTAACVNNVCQFTFSTPPPPPPGGCPYQSHCVDDYNCVFPGGITGTCVNNVCVC